ncbi:hypothetical protein COCCU_02240 [Corynebacterium occultum]|uniref:DUF3068 domain-containing protein n=2 Tax=Corynebacterium occultum TaxID=2675219 RepID=A0A6B8VLQ9_9CORY|nr:hypothetical protein COCCU_02240 [Corynebacterium occultum]
MDLKVTTFSITDDQASTRIMSDPGGRVVESPVTRQIHLEVQNPVDADAATVRVGTSLARGSQQSDLDRLISAEVWNYRIDRLSGAALSPANVSDQPASPVREVEVDGIWVKFPSNAEQTTYEVFDQTLRESHPAVFQEELEMGGQTVYRYHQVIEPQNVAQRWNGVFNTTDFMNEDGSTEQGYLFHGVERDFFVDQNSGLIVDIQEKVDNYYGTADGEAREVVLEFDGEMSDEQVEERLNQAAEVPQQSTAQLIRWIIVGFGGLLILLGLAGSFGIFGGRNSPRR